MKENYMSSIRNPIQVTYKECYSYDNRFSTFSMKSQRTLRNAHCLRVPTESGSIKSHAANLIPSNKRWILYFSSFKYYVTRRRRSDSIMYSKNFEKMRRFSNYQFVKIILRDINVRSSLVFRRSRQFENKCAIRVYQLIIKFYGTHYNFLYFYRQSHLSMLKCAQKIFLFPLCWTICIYLQFA